METYRLRARNTALTSDNKIHDDAVAREYGFRGGLVPGVDVYAYLVHPVVERWGRDWLERGTMSARFASPVYDGDEVAVDAGDVDGALRLVLHDGEGHDHATGTATLPRERAEAPDPAAWPAAPLPDDPPAATAGTLRALDPIGTLALGFRAAKAPEYLAEVGEPDPIYTREGIAHPGWLLRLANWALAANVRLGPWIHVSSDVRNLGSVGDGDRVEVRGRTADVFERKGHEFVDLDLCYVANGDRPVARVLHRAIYRPRPAT